MQGRDERMEGERGETDGQTDRQAGRRSVEKELWQEDKARKTQADKDRGDRGW